MKKTLILVTNHYRLTQQNTFIREKSDRPKNKKLFNTIFILICNNFRNKIVKDKFSTLVYRKKFEIQIFD